MAQRRFLLTKAQAEAFYAVHKERPFYGSCGVHDLGAGRGAGARGRGRDRRNREVMGATDPAKAAAGTIRKDFANDREERGPRLGRPGDRARRSPSSSPGSTSWGDGLTPGPKNGPPWRAPGPSPEHAALIERFRRARSDPARVVLEGFHALKDLGDRFWGRNRAWPARPIWATSARSRAGSRPTSCRGCARTSGRCRPRCSPPLAPGPVETGAIAIARRPQVDAQAVLQRPGAAPVVLLEAPAHLGNLGAVVRRRGRRGRRGGAHHRERTIPGTRRRCAVPSGLHFALPVARIEAAAAGKRAPAAGHRPRRASLWARVRSPTAHSWPSARNARG